MGLLPSLRWSRGDCSQVWLWGEPSGHRGSCGKPSPPGRDGQFRLQRVLLGGPRGTIPSTRIMVRTKSLVTKSKPPTLRETGSLREGQMLSQLTTLGPGKWREDKYVHRFLPGLETGLVKQMTCQGDAVLGAEAGPAQQVLLTLLPSNHPIGTHTPEAVPSVFTDKEMPPECSLVQAGLGARAKYSLS